MTIRGMLHHLFCVIYSPLLLLMRKTKGLENVPAKGSYIVASNHYSYLDAMMLHVLFYFKYGVTLRFLATEKLYRNPLARVHLELAGSIMVCRNDKIKCINDSIEALSQNNHIGIFPEGGIHFPNKKREPKTGVVRISSGSQKYIIPIHIKQRMLTFVMCFIPILRRTEVIMGKPIIYPNKFMNSRKKLKNNAYKLMELIYHLK